MKLSNSTIGKIDLTFQAIRRFIYDIECDYDLEENNQEANSQRLAEDIYNIWGGSYQDLNGGKEFQWKDLYNRGGTFELVKEEGKDA